MRAEGYAVESILRVLSQQGLSIAARTYRSWKQPARLAGTSRAAVDRAMRPLGLEGIRRAKKRRTTIPGPEGKRAGDLLNRDFTAPAANLVWVTDFTYVGTWAGFVYVAFVVDVFAQRIVGWHASSSMRTDLVMTPLRIAVHVDPVHRAPRPRGHRCLDRDRRRCVR